jgi:hypothetical protein
MSIENPSVWFAVCKFRAMPRAGRSEYITFKVASDGAVPFRLRGRGNAVHDPSVSQSRGHTNGGFARMRAWPAAHPFLHVWRLLIDAYR